MRQKVCKRCGKIFQAVKQEYLCSECHAVRKKECAITKRVCKICGASFESTPRALYCKTCAAVIRKERDKAQKKNGPARPLGSTDRCITCGAEYIVASGLQKYCKQCAEESARNVTRAQKRQYMAGRKEINAALKVEMYKNSQVCIICGNIFDAHTRRVTCSAECDAIRRKNNQKRKDQKRSPRTRRKKDEC